MPGADLEVLAVGLNYLGRFGIQWIDLQVTALYDQLANATCIRTVGYM